MRRMELRCGGASGIGGAAAEGTAAGVAHTAGVAGMTATAATTEVGAVRRASLTAPSAQGDITPKKQQALRCDGTGMWQALAAWQHECFADIDDTFIGQACT